MLRLIASRAARGAPRRGMTVTTMKEPGVVGLSMDSDPRGKLAGLYKETLEAVKDMPADAAYRVNVEKITKYRLEVVNATEDIEKIEQTLNVGQIPEIIEQAQDELDLIPYMADWKPWETDGKKPANIEVVQ